MASEESQCVPDKLAIEPGPNMRARHHSGTNMEKVSTDLTLSGRRRAEPPLSQVQEGMSHRERLAWLQQRRCTGLWALCDTCHKYRYLQHVHDPLHLPEKWHCSMNPDERYSECDVPEVVISVADEEDMVHGAYAAGSVVWARMKGFPRWPALVDDDPDTEQYYWLDDFSDIPIYYHVVFFDGAEQQTQRAWIPTGSLQKYEHTAGTERANGIFARRLTVARRQANEALALPVQERLRKYSFLARYTGPINPPSKFSSKELQRYGSFTDDSSEEEECDYANKRDASLETPPTSMECMLAESSVGSELTLVAESKELTDSAVY